MNAVKTEHTWLTLQDAGKLMGKNPSAIRMWVKRKIAKGEQILIKKKKGKHGDIMLIHSSEIEHVNARVNTENKSPSFNGEQNLHNIAIYEDESVNPEPLTGSAQYASIEPEVLTNSEHVKGSFIEFIEFYDKKRIEWERERDSLMQGLLMYRYKFEEVDRQLKVLPAPPEYVKAKIDELEKNLQEEARAKSLLAIEKAETEEEKEQLRKDYEDFLSQLRSKLSEEERIKEELRTDLEKAMADLNRPWWKKLFGIK